MSLDILFLLTSFVLFYLSGSAFFYSKYIKTSPASKIILGFCTYILSCCIGYRLNLNINIINNIYLIISISFFILNKSIVNQLKIEFRKYIIFLIPIVFLAIIFSLGDESQKVFQSFPYDRFSYLSGALSFSDSTLNIINRNVREIFGFGNITPFVVDHIRARAPGEINSRPAVEFLFSGLTSWFSGERYRLANAFEQLYRILLYVSVFRLAIKLRVKYKTAIFIALITTLGFWGQDAKDYNAWSMQYSLPLWIFIVGYFPPIGETSKRFSSLIAPILILTTSLVIYPEGSIWFAAIFGLAQLIYLKINIKYYKKLIYNGVLFLFSFLLMVCININAIDFLVRQFKQIGSFGMDSVAKSASNMLLPFYGTLMQKADNILILASPLLHPLQFVNNFYNFLLGIFGFYLTIRFHATVKILIFGFILYIFFKTYKDSKVHKNLIFLLIIIVVEVIAPFGLLWSGNFYGWGRGIIYSGVICSAIFIIIVSRNLDNKIFKLVFALYIVLNTYFAINVISYQYKNKYENIGMAYEMAKERVYFSKSDGKIRDQLSFDLALVSDQVLFCNRVYVNVSNPWQEVYVLAMLKSKHIIYSLAHRPLTGIYDGDVWGLHLPKKELHDCIIETIKLDNRDVVDLIFADRNLSARRGYLGSNEATKK
ncbi:hypothetical protein G6703_01705 [Polynucleobacter paneuropaeus]|nr:hypothetical protein G6703_01705 [Polynucleobacter paneuropaeus]